jgi:DNA/RNA-binding domain of Phe-tRNA-synthetase-like protein
MFQISEDWRLAYPGAAVGFLVLHGVTNPEQHPELNERAAQLESNLRVRFGGLPSGTLTDLPTLQAYAAYYRPFKKTYHVLLQLQSVIYKGKSIPRTSALVQSMFMAELQNQLLTAGHDLDVLEPPVRVGISTGQERYTLLRGEEQPLKAGDMMMQDAQGVISSILYGPDLRTRIHPGTTRVMYAVYAAPGIVEGLVYEHLRSIQENVQVFSPQAHLDRLEIFTS